VGVGICLLLRGVGSGFFRVFFFPGFSMLLWCQKKEG
jgi:hypothetical protein